MKSTSHYIPSVGRNLLHLKELSPDGEARATILFIHGSIEDGRIFYSEKGKGLAPFLVEHGFQCLILDSRARGKSTPPLKDNHLFNQTDILNEDFPRIFEFIKANTNQQFSIITHSWGGVHVNSFLLTHSKWIPLVKSVVHISTKRRVSVLNLHRLFYIDLMWKLVGDLFILFKGYLPAGTMGPEGESRGTLKDTQKWVYSKEWIDQRTKTDYRLLAKSINLPPTWYLTGKNDMCLGHIRDVTDFALESGHESNQVTLLSKDNGNLEDYDHISILTSKKALEDHFPKIKDFLLNPSIIN